MRQSQSKRRTSPASLLLCALPIALLAPSSTHAIPSLTFRNRSRSVSSPLNLLPRDFSASSNNPQSYIYNVRPTLWVPQDTYSGTTFFDEWDFFGGADPTHGQVNYVTRDQAWGRLAYVDGNNKVVMQVDRWNNLTAGASRDSVRIVSKKVYNQGLYVLDVEQAPFGCGVWPAFWTVGPNWPNQGEIDVLEGVHDNIHNQVSFHTGPTCQLAPGNFTGSILADGNCNSQNNLPGCGIIDPSRASYGPEFNNLGGGVFAMMWDVTGVKVWFFHRASIPHDISGGTPDPTGWGMPSAAAAASQCDPTSSFKDHQIIFDITFCGDWAGSSYVDSGCPGTCSDRIMDPNNFLNASWSINYLHVYRDAKLTISGPSKSGASRVSSLPFSSSAFAPIYLLSALLALSYGLVFLP